MATKTNASFVQCIHCKKVAALMQWYENPLIAVCKDTHERQVAETNRDCKLFVPNSGKDDLPPVQHFDNYDQSKSYT